MGFSAEHLKNMTIEIERWVAMYVGNECSEMRKLPYGAAVASEIYLSVSALFAARAIAYVHLWTGESLESIQKRFDEATLYNLKSTMKKITEQMLPEKGDSDEDRG